MSVTGRRRRRKSRETVRSETSIASFPNSPWIKPSAPHKGLAAPICFTSLRMAALVLGRPGPVGVER